MKHLVFVVGIAALSATTGCVGVGATVSPAEGRITVDLTAQDCITENLLSRAIEVVPVVGDWVMLNWGCAAIGTPVDGSQ